MRTNVAEREAPPTITQVTDIYDYEDFFENGVIGLRLVDRDGIILCANKAELDMLGYAAHEYVGRPIGDFHVDAEIIADALRRLLAGERLDKHPARMLTKEGAVKHVLISASALFRDGQLIHSRWFSLDLGIDETDVTGRLHAEQRLRDSERRSRELLNALPMAVYTTDADGRITYYNEAAVALAGRRPRLGIDRWCVSWKLYCPDGTPMPHDHCPMAHALTTGEELRGIEAIAERPDGTRRVFTPFPTLLRDALGKVVGAINVLVDITELKRATDEQRVLIDELNHRVKNTLATVQSICLHTYRSTPHEFVQRFEDRLMALSKTHNLLTRRRWTGVGISELLEQEFAPYNNPANTRIALDGPELTLAPRTGLVLSMVMHELITNAAKYGALSTDAGSVRISWTLNATEEPARQALFSLRWSEQGGPPVESPARCGFGHRLIERGITRDLGGRAELHFDREGLQCSIDFPLQ